MADQPTPVLRTTEKIVLVGTMVIYDSQREASEGIPRQWSRFRELHPALRDGCDFFGASPCTGDRRIHYLTGVVQRDWVGPIDGQTLTLEAGEYAVIPVEDAALLRDTWSWLLASWLPRSGRRETKSPEFERYSAMSENGVPVGPVEIWIPLEHSETA